MPIYEYKCDKCGVVEVMQRITEAPLKKCPNCKSKVERMISPSSFVLKGSGWYQSDYGRKNDKVDKAAESSANGSSTESKSGESKSGETKSSSSSDSSDSKSTGSSADKPSSKKADKPATKSAD
jgi:putative FmdB family regulatory protein